MLSKRTYILATTMALMISPVYAQPHAQHGMVDGTSYLAKDRFQVRGRVLGVLPQEDGLVNIGGDVKVSNSLAAEVDLTYFLTDHIATEIIAGTTHHDLEHTSGAKLGETWLLPPTVTVQYHFTPHEKFSPYVGAGLNYSLFYDEKPAAGFIDLDIDNGIGYAAQAGFDYWLNENWGLNLDVKKLFLNVDASLNQGTVKADVDLDPWIVGVGVSYRFF